MCVCVCVCMCVCRLGWWSVFMCGCICVFFWVFCYFYFLFLFIYFFYPTDKHLFFPLKPPSIPYSCYAFVTILAPPPNRQLSDVTRDGSLSLQEFFTAMHLVVLRRNNIELPETLPPSLYPELLVREKEEEIGEGGGNRRRRRSILMTCIVSFYYETRCIGLL